jgi:HD-GYP domain-containing protein (c-di-GMP phosphodiesterase class II)
MLRSKRIADYVEAKLSDFRPGVKVPVDVHLYFRANRHILVWRKGGEVLSPAFIDKYRSRGMERVWIHRDDAALWSKYVKDADPKITTENYVFGGLQHPIMEAGEIKKPVEPPVPRTEEGKQMTELMQDSSMDQRRRTALVARAARDLLADTAAPQDPAMQAESIAHAREAVRDVVDSTMEATSAEIRTLLEEMWNLSELDPELDHAVNVATYAVLFAMAFGRISQDLIADIALAGLVHDIGLSQIPAYVVTTPWKEQKGRAAQLYARHVDEGIKLVDEHAPTAPARMRPMVSQHHEKFDGSGYPLQLQGFQVNDIAQLVTFADILDSMASGRWDGVERTLHETFVELESIEKSRNFPEYLNPEVFSAVIKWIRNPRLLTGAQKASDIVRTTAREILRHNKPRKSA